LGDWSEAAKFGNRFVNLDNGELRINAVKDIKSSVDYLVTNVPVVEAEQVVNNPVAASGGLSTWLWNRTSRFMVLRSRREEELLTHKL
jgi:hypothetical protein